jgi:peptide/nickel transport system permease protein
MSTPPLPEAALAGDALEHTLDGVDPGQQAPNRKRLLARRIVGRIIGAIIVLWAAATVTFAITAILPGNRAVLILNQQTGRQERSYPASQTAPINHQYGFSKPVLDQYWDYIKNLAHGDFGTSYTQHEPVLTLIGHQVWPTIELTVTSLVLAWVIALAVILGTAKRGKFISKLGSGFEIISAGIPYYWLGVILLVIFAIDLKMFPVAGNTSLSGLVLPGLTLAIPLAGFLGQVVRDEFEKVLDQPFITTARARGMGDFSVRWRHALRHAVLPAITLSGWALGSLISGAVLVETIFARPGLGNMLVTAAESRDIPLVSGIVILVAVVYVLANVLVDIAYALVDPRIGMR